MNRPQSKIGFRLWLAALGFVGATLAAQPASAGYFELSAGFSFSKSNYGGNDFGWTRRWNSSFGYHFSDISEIELGFQDSVTRTSISGYQDTTTHDQTYSLSWVQSLFGRDAIFDPYFRFGMGQLNRTATGTYYSLGGASADSEVASLTEILGVGGRFGLSRRFAIRVEADTYITDWKLSTWRDNVYFTVGLTIYY